MPLKKIKMNFFVPRVYTIFFSTPFEIHLDFKAKLYDAGKAARVPRFEERTQGWVDAVLRFIAARVPRFEEQRRE